MAPEKLYIDSNDNLSDSILYAFTEMRKDGDIEYIRKDVFVERALKWYCLDCECNDGCKADCHCFFKEAFKQYLKGNEKALPPKIEDTINPDGSTSENYRYRHFIRRMQDAFIEKAAKWIEENANNYTERVQTIIGSVKIVNTEKMANDFKKAMI